MRRGPGVGQRLAGLRPLQSILWYEAKPSRTIPLIPSHDASGTRGMAVPLESDALSEPDLVRGAARGDARAFHSLTDRYYRPVCGFVLKRVQRSDLVEDLAQETFLEAFR